MYHENDEEPRSPTDAIHDVPESLYFGYSEFSVVIPGLSGVIRVKLSYIYINYHVDSTKVRYLNAANIKTTPTLRSYILEAAHACV